jgi:hypothetical protein
MPGVVFGSGHVIRLAFRRVSCRIWKAAIRARLLPFWQLFSAAMDATAIGVAMVVSARSGRGLDCWSFCGGFGYDPFRIEKALNVDHAW